MTHVHCCDEVDAEAAFERGQATIDVERLARALSVSLYSPTHIDQSNPVRGFRADADRIAAEYARLTGGQDDE